VRPSAAAALLERVARQSRRRVGAVLVYHRIADRPRGQAFLDARVPARVFERQLAFLAERYHVVATGDLLDAVAARRRRRRFPVAITFDDDLESHVSVARRALSAARLPATFFLTGRTLHEPSPFWWDDLEQILHAGVLRPDALPQLPSELIQAAAAGGVRATADLARAVELLEPSEQQVVAHALRQVAGEPSDRGLSAGAVRELARLGFEIGFHTLHHHRLVELHDEQLERALSEGREPLEEAAETSLRDIAYPHGDADERVGLAAHRAGYLRGFTGAARVATPETDPLLIARFQVAPSLEGLSMQLARALAWG
jgi:peptidoglycan/xylan/chitin deacetylase (PgdA/CDA1 family)